MIATAETLTKLTTVPSEQEAAIIVAALAEEGIEACYMGDTTANFRVGVPGKVHVHVKAVDMVVARQKLEEVANATKAGDSHDEDESAQNPVRLFAWRVLVLIILLLMLLIMG